MSQYYEYEHLLAVDFSRGIRANVVYQSIGDNFIGSYFGYEGGGAYSDSFFWINAEGDVITDWDTSEFPENYRKPLESLALIRNSFESNEDEGDLSDLGLELELSDNTTEEENHWEYWSDNFDWDVIVPLSKVWALSMRWIED